MKLDYGFNDPALRDQALTHKSAGKINNERLEFIGDSIVNFIVAEALFERFPDATEGQLSKVRSQLVKQETLAEIARERQLGDDLFLGSGELKSGGFRRDSILSDALEALIAAIYLDSDFHTCKTIVLQWYEEKLQTISIDSDHRDYKSRLQETLQARGEPLPEYRLLEAQGLDHLRSFTVSCSIGAGKSFTGGGKSKKQAEQLAAKAALEALEKK